jgi:predicted oxidoreductase
MRSINIGKGEILVSEVSLGCMRMADLSVKEASDVLGAALESGIDFFDHADVYGNGKSEEIFAKAVGMNPTIRKKIFLQSKCGIRTDPKSFDFSKEHILDATHGILKRLQTEYLDVLLLHRPDALMEPDEIAEAFTRLHISGKVRYFGVSNQNPMQIELLSRCLNQKIMVNQMQLSIMHTPMIDAGFTVNMKTDAAVDRDGGILDYCRIKDITVQAWSPFQYGFFEGVFLDNGRFPDLNQTINKIAAKYGVPNTAVAVAWISRHPAHIQTIIGSMNPGRIKDICRESEFSLTRQEWYDIYLAAGNALP